MGRRERAEALPDVVRLVRDFRWAVDHRDANYWQRQRLNYDARRCLWPNKSGDGRKWASESGKDVFPWVGAADSEVQLVDKYIREDAALLMAMWQQNRIMVRPTKPAQDAGWANRVTTFLRWMVYDHIEEAEDEAELLANYYLERGAAVLGTFWDRTEVKCYDTIQMDQLVAAAEQASQRLAQFAQAGRTGPETLALQASLPDLIADPAQEDVVLQLIQPWLGEREDVSLTDGQLRKLLKQLRETGEAKFPKITVLRDRPTFAALGLNEDLFLPPETTAVNLMNVPQMFRRELVTETNLQERARTMGWDAAWVDQVIETQRGKVTEWTQHNRGSKTYYRTSGHEWDTARLYEIVHAYERRYDDEGVPGIFYTCLSPHLSDRVGLSELLNYAHGNYPFTVFQLERRARKPDESRGYGERCHTWQRAIKTEWDSRIDRASIATLPPSYFPPGEAPDQWGPGVKISTRRPEGFGFMEIPRYDPGSKEAEETVRRFADEYFGRPVDEQNTLESTLLKQELTRGWMKGWRRAYKQALQLCQQFMPDEFYFRVVGDEKGRLIRSTREQIQGECDVTVTYNVRDLDPEFVKQKLELIQQATMLDRNGRVDADEALQMAIELIDPSYAERLLRPGEEASASEIDDEKSVLAQLLVGIPVDVKPGQAYGLRLKTMMGLIQASPSVQQILMQNPVAQELVKTRGMQLKHQLDQQQNAQTGKFLGTKPMMQQMQEQQGGGMMG